MNTVRTLAVMIAMTLPTLIGCIGVATESPFGNIKDALPIDESLLREWQTEDDNLKVSFSRAGQNFPASMYRMTMAGYDDPYVTCFYITKLENRKIINIVEFVNDKLPKKWDPKLVRCYYAVQLERRGKQLLLKPNNEKSIVKAVKAGKLKRNSQPDVDVDVDLDDLDLDFDGQSTEPDELIVTSSRADLLEYANADIDAYFSGKKFLLKPVN